MWFGAHLKMESVSLLGMSYQRPLALIFFATFGKVFSSSNVANL